MAGTLGLLIALSALPGAPASAVGALPSEIAVPEPQTDPAPTEFWLVPGVTEVGEPESSFISVHSATTPAVRVGWPGTGHYFLHDWGYAGGEIRDIMFAKESLTADEGVFRDWAAYLRADRDVTVGLWGAAKLEHDGYYWAGLESYVPLASSSLGTTHRVVGRDDAPDDGWGGALVVVATKPNTTLTVTPKVALRNHPAGMPFDVSLGEGDTYRLIDPNADITGTLVVSDQPVAVYSGQGCSVAPGVFSLCGAQVEPIPPMSSWGKEFAWMRSATRSMADRLRFVASEDDTTVSVNGVPLPALAAGEFHERLLTQAASITSDKPILVAQFTDGEAIGATDRGSLMMLIPPTAQYVTAYKISVLADTTFRVNYLNVVAPAAAVGSIVLNGTAIPVESFSPIGDSGFSGARVYANRKKPNVLTGPAGFGLHSYGTGVGSSYGFTGDMSGPSAEVANRPPTLSAEGPYTGVEGAWIRLTARAEDPDYELPRYAWTVTPAAGAKPGAACYPEVNLGSQAPWITCTEDGVYVVTVTASDGGGHSVSSTTELTVTNAPPAVKVISPTHLSLIKTGSPATFEVTMTDVGPNDSLTCTISWGDGTSSAGRVLNYFPKCSGTHTFTTPGLHEVRVTARDDDGGRASHSIFVTVFEEDSTVTGGGYIRTSSGRVSFGFVAKDADDALSGELYLRLADRKLFRSESVTSLNVSGEVATWSGTGTLDGVAGYTYSLTAHDNQTDAETGTPDAIEGTITSPGGAVVAAFTGSLRAGSIAVQQP
ncbi:MAG: PKD domain-containing protein [Micropruina sp.]